MARVVFRSVFVLLLLSPLCFAQDPLPVLKFSWKLDLRKAPKNDVQVIGPARELTKDDMLMQRNARQMQINAQDPGEISPDGRRSQIDKIEQEAKTPQPDDQRGYTYSARVHNAADRTVKVIYWEYKFTELANPKNSVRRQFLCAVNLKKGSEMDLNAFSTLGPTDVIDAKYLNTEGQKLYDEQVQVNRIEYSDDNIVQRGNWKFADVKSAVDRATSTPWGKEICRAL
jgi:hypothetical protein